MPDYDSMSADPLIEFERAFAWACIFESDYAIGLLDRAGVGHEIIADPFVAEVVECCIRLRREGKDVNHHVLQEELGLRHRLDDWMRWAEILSADATSARAITNLKMVISRHQQRVIEREGKAIAGLAGEELEKRKAEAQSTIDAAMSIAIGEAPKGYRDVALEGAAELREMMEGRAVEDDRSIVTGIRSVDAICQPLSVSTGDFNVLLFAATSMGKSSLMCQMVCRNAFAGRRVAVFLGETDSKGMIFQMAGQMTRVAIGRREFPMEPRDRQSKLAEAYDGIARMCGRNLFIHHADFTLESILSKCRELAKQGGGLDLVVIDHMHILKVRRSFKDERLKFNHISGSLKPLGIELNCPILTLAQPNRGLKTSDRAPSVSDLKESGNLEDDADRIWALWMPPKDDFGREQDRKTEEPQINLEQLKMRRGRVTFVPLRFEKRYTRFYDPSERTGG